MTSLRSDDVIDLGCKRGGGANRKNWVGVRLAPKRCLCRSGLFWLSFTPMPGLRLGRRSGQPGLVQRARPGLGQPE